MAHRDAKVIVPIGTVNTKAKLLFEGIVVEEQDIGNARKIVVATIFFGATAHFLRFDFGPNRKGAIGSAVVGARGNREVEDSLAIFKAVEALSGEINFNILSITAGKGDGVSEDLSVE